MAPSLSKKQRLLYQHLSQVKSTTSSVDRHWSESGEGGSVDLVGTKVGAEVESGVSLTLGAGVSLALGAARSKKVPMAKQTMRLIIVLIGGCDCCEAQLYNDSPMALADVCTQSVGTSPRILHRRKTMAKEVEPNDVRLPCFKYTCIARSRQKLDRTARRKDKEYMCGYFREGCNF